MTTTKPELTTVQKDRLLLAAKLTAEAYESFLVARGTEASWAELRKAEANFNADLSHFDQLKSHRGLLPGDRIRIVVDGPFLGEEGVIRDWRTYNTELEVDWPETSPCHSHPGSGECVPTSESVELVEARQ